jgi:hypothetical protein
LRPDDLAVDARDRAEAAERIARQWAAEFHAKRNAPTPDEDVADASTQARHQADIARQLRERRARRATTTPSPGTVAPDTTSPEPASAPAPGASSDEVYQRALEMSRSLGRAPRPRRNRRRDRWT